MHPSVRASVYVRTFSPFFGHCLTQINTRKLSYRKDHRVMRLIYRWPENFRESLSMPTATFAEIFNGLLFRSILWMCIQKLKFVALPIPEIIGGTQKFGQSLDTPTLPFLPNFNGLMFECTLWIYLQNLHAVRIAVPVPEIIAIAFWGWGCEPPMLGKGSRRGSGMVPFETSKERWWVPIGLHSNFSSIFARFRDTAALVLQHAIFPHPTSSLPKNSPCSPGSRWMAFGLRRAKVLGFQDFQPM